LRLFGPARGTSIAKSFPAFGRDLCRQMPLPIPAEIDGRSPLHRPTGDVMYLGAVAHAAVVFPPESFLSIPEQIDARDMMMVASFGPTPPPEIFLCHVRAGTVEAIGLLMIDPLHFERRVQAIP
jgi:hypothetical protein